MRDNCKINRRATSIVVRCKNLVKGVLGDTIVLNGGMSKSLDESVMINDQQVNLTAPGFKNPQIIILIQTMQLYSSSVSHHTHNATGPGYLCELKWEFRQSKAMLGNTKLCTFSCHPNSTLPLTSPHPGMAIPLYRYFIRVSCAS